MVLLQHHPMHLNSLCRSTGLCQLMVVVSTSLLLACAPPQLPNEATAVLSNAIEPPSRLITHRFIPPCGLVPFPRIGSFLRRC